MATSLQIALGLCNSLKIIEKPGSADIINIRLRFNTLIYKLSGYFAAIAFGDKTEVEVKELTSHKPFTQKLLLVLGQISDVIGTEIYMDKILENGDTMPKYRLKIIGAQSDILLVHGIAKYLYTMQKNLHENLRKYRPTTTHPGTYTRLNDKEIFDPLIKMFSDPNLVIMRMVVTPYRLLKIKERKLLHWVFIFLKFDNNKKRVNPLLAVNKGIKIPLHYYTYGGKFKKHSLIGTKWDFSASQPQNSTRT